MTGGMIRIQREWTAPRRVRGAARTGVLLGDGERPQKEATLELFIKLLITTPWFASRPALAALFVMGALATGLFGEVPEEWPVPVMAVMFVAGALAAVELVVAVVQHLIQDMSAWWAEWLEKNPLAPVGMALFVAAVVIAALRGEPPAAEPHTLAAGLFVQWLWLAPLGFSAWVFATLRVRVEAFLEELTGGLVRGIGVSKLWAQVLMTAVGISVAVLLPAVGAVVYAFALCMLVATFLILRDRQQALYRTCACGVKVHRAAFVCGGCARRHEPLALGLFGTPSSGRSVEDPARHRVALLARGRCERCASPLTSKERRLACPLCGPVVVDEARAAALSAYADKRFAKLLLPALVMGAVPLLGLPAALAWYRGAGMDAYAAFAGWKTRLGRRVGVAVALVALGALQAIPILGALPTVALLFLLYASARLRFRLAMREQRRSAGADTAGAPGAPGELDVVAAG